MFFGRSSTRRENPTSLRRKRVQEREDEVYPMKKKSQEIVECLKGRKELLRKDEEFILTRLKSG